MIEPLALCDRVVEMLGDRGEAAVSASTGVLSLTRFANSAIHQNHAEDATTVTVDVVVDGRTARAATNRVDDESLSALVERALAAARVRPVDPDWPGLAPPASVPAVDHFDEATHDANPDARAAVVRAFVDAGPGLEAAGYCDTASSVQGFANSLGQRAEQRSSRATIDGIHRAPGADGNAHQTSSRLADLDGKAAGATAAHKASTGVDAVDVEPGTYEVVLERSCVADILQFLLLAGFNGKAHAEGRSFVHLDEQQFDPAISLWDDATDPRTIGVAFDAEGTPKRRFDLVREGVSVGLTHDRRSAAKAGTETTGHCVGLGGFGGFATNIFMAAGSTSLDQMVASVERGLLVSDFWYTRILDPKTQVVTGLTRNGVFLIENGEVTRPVKNLRFTQSYAAALAPGRVKAVGSDGALVNRTHVPSLHLTGWSFTGGARG